MKKMLLVLSTILLLSFVANAASTVYAFTFRDTSGNPYCDGLVVQLYKPNASTPKAVVGGYHFNYDCANTSSVGGFKHGLNAIFQYAAIGPVLDIADSFYGLESSNRSGQWIVNTTYHTWVLYSGNDFAGNYVVNFGTYVPNTSQVGLKGTVKKPASQP